MISRVDQFLAYLYPADSNIGTIHPGDGYVVQTHATESNLISALRHQELAPHDLNPLPGLLPGFPSFPQTLCSVHRFGP